jgi:hypothetical protein
MDILTLASRYPRTSLTVALVPWKETDSMKERVEFVLEWKKRCKRCANPISTGARDCSSGDPDEEIRFGRRVR